MDLANWPPDEFAELAELALSHWKTGLTEYERELQTGLERGLKADG